MMERKVTLSWKKSMQWWLNRKSGFSGAVGGGAGLDGEMYMQSLQCALCVDDVLA